MAGLLLSAAGVFTLLSSAQAGPSTFTDNDGDLMLVFRKTGFDGSGDVGSYVYEVDIGSASTYTTATPGSSIPVSTYSAANLNTLFDSLNDFSWSVSGCIPNYGGAGVASTLWVSDPRPVPSSPAIPWKREGTYTQGGSAAYIESILSGAATYAAVTTNSTYNTLTSLAIPYANGDSANGYLGAIANFDGNFQGDIENTTPPTFSTDGLPSRSDLYELVPGSGAGVDLGYFELSTNGSLTFYAAGGAASYPAPILTVTAASRTVNISFASTAGGTYTLFYTTAAGLGSPVSTWSKGGSAIIGDGTVKTFQQSATGAGTFYAVGVH